MSEKRFTVRRDEKGAILIPNSILKDGEIIDEEEIVDLLNEQQSTIKELEEEIKLLKPTNIEQYEQIQKLRKELSDCEKFRYTVFKRLNDEHIKERSIK